MKLYGMAFACMLLVGTLQAGDHSSDAKTDLTGELYGAKGKSKVNMESMYGDNRSHGFGFKDEKNGVYMTGINAEVMETYRNLGLAMEKQVEVSTIISLDKENKQLKEKVKELEAQIEILKKRGTIVETMTETPTSPVPTAKTAKKEFRGAKLKIGGTAPQKLSAYYAAAFQTVDALKAKLEANGFTVLAVTPVLEGKNVITVTDDELKKTNTWLATLHILVDEGNEIRVQNPSYFGAAYLQDAYKYGQFTTTLTALQNVLGDMYEVEEKYALSDLPKYQFMFGMPYLNDTITVAEGDNLIGKVTGGESNKYVAYTLTLPNGNVLVGHKLRNRTNKFLLKIKEGHNAEILPYESMIEKKKAVMLDPKYYLALSLPLLSMSDFMKIASAPGEIEKDVKRAYK